MTTNENRDFFYGFKKFKKKDEKIQFKNTIKGIKELICFLEIPEYEKKIILNFIKKIFKNKYNTTIIHLELPNCYTSYMIPVRDRTNKIISLSSINYKSPYE